MESGEDRGAADGPIAPAPVSVSGVEDASLKLLRIMDQFEERAAEHLRRYADLRMGSYDQVDGGSRPGPGVEAGSAKLESGAPVALADSYSAVVGRRILRGFVAAGRSLAVAGGSSRRRVSAQARGNMRAAGMGGANRPPRPSVVVVKSTVAERSSVDLMRLAKERTPSSVVDANCMRVREAVSGGLVIEISGARE